MPYETILYEVADGVATVTLNRPERYNALTIQMYQELLDALKKIARDSSVRVVVLTGSGKAFSSGADLVEVQSKLGQFDVGEMLRTGLNKVALGIRGLEKPVICAVNGVVAGAGAGVALACDMRIASEKASFVFAAFINIGIIPDGGVTYFLPQIVGVSKAFELAMFADANNRVSADDALNYGIVNKVVPHEALAEEAGAVAQRMATMATKGIGLSKRAMYKNAETALATALEYEAATQTVAFNTKDFQEGVMAFIERRDANFTGE